MSAEPNLKNFSLYVHWPFCQSKCPYCDFNSHVSNSHDSIAFGEALCEELTYTANLIPSKRPLTSIFFGGGTPSLMPASIVGKIISRAEKLFGFVPEIEITSEANPTSVEAKAMAEFCSAGVNRVSMGVQSFDNQLLKFLGREHSADEALNAIETVRKQFSNLSIDLIYATPDQTLRAWENCLSIALNLDLPHLSLYQLTIEPGTIFYTRQRAGEKMHLNDDTAADLFELTQSMTAASGLPAYEISNHAKNGSACQHNLTYWHAADWIGIGPGAHGRFSKVNKNPLSLIHRIGTSTLLNPTSWLKAVKTNKHGIAIQQNNTPNDLANEMIMMGLRLTDGVKLDEIAALCGPVDSWLDLIELEKASDAGWLNISLNNDDCNGQYTRLKTTESGRLRLNSLLAMILR